MTTRNTFIALAVLALLPVISGCTPVGVAAGVGGSAGMAAASEGGIPRALEDTRIRAAINDAWFRTDLEMFSKLNLAVNQGRVLVTGVVQKPEHRIEAIRLVWKVEGVKQVDNEVKIANSEGVKGYVRDNWIAGTLKSKLLFDKDIQSVNYSVDVVQGVVYLMGVAQNQRELNKVVYHSRNTDYVRNVVSHVRLLGQPVNTEVPVVNGVLQGSSVTSAPVAGNTPMGDPSGDSMSAPSSASIGAVQSSPLPPVGSKTIKGPKPIVGDEF